MVLQREPHHHWIVIAERVPLGRAQYLAPLQESIPRGWNEDRIAVIGLVLVLSPAERLRQITVGVGDLPGVEHVELASQPVEQPQVVNLAFFQTAGMGQTGKRPPVLLQNQPNPFSGKTTIGLLLPEACEATMRVLDGKGRLLRAYQQKEKLIRLVKTFLLLSLRYRLI